MSTAKRTHCTEDSACAGVQKDVEVRKDREISTERKGSNEPIMPVEELLGTALSSESLPEPAKQLIASAGANSGDGLGGLQQAFGRGMRQASAQDLEKQHQNMAAAQEQVACLLLIAFPDPLVASLCVELVLMAWRQRLAANRGYFTVVSERQSA